MINAITTCDHFYCEDEYHERPLLLTAWFVELKTTDSNEHELTTDELAREWGLHYDDVKLPLKGQ